MYKRIFVSLIVVTCFLALGFIFVVAEEGSNSTDKNIALPKESVAQPNETSEQLPVLTHSPHWIGVRVTPVPDVLLSQFGENKKGLVVIEQVIAEGPAAKAGLQRGDVILQFAGQDISSLTELVEQVSLSNATEQTVKLIRAGKIIDCTVTPGPRPHQPVSSMNNILGGRSFPIIPGDDWKLGPEFMIGPRDPRKMMREMEEYFRQMQGGVDGEQLLILPQEEDDGALSGMPNSSSNAESLIISQSEVDGKTKIKVKQTIKNGNQTEEKQWEADSIDALPDEIREKVQLRF